MTKKPVDFEIWFSSMWMYRLADPAPSQKSLMLQAWNAGIEHSMKKIEEELPGLTSTQVLGIGRSVQHKSEVIPEGSRLRTDSPTNIQEATVGTAEKFMMLAVQAWGQTDKERVDAVQAVLDEVGINAKATGWPIFGGVWKAKCTGPDRELADKFLKDITDTMKRGDYGEEVAHIKKKIEEFKKR